MSTFISKSSIFFLSCFLIIFGFPGQSVGICALTDSIINSTGLSRNVFSAIYACATITGCFLILFSGSIIDRLGVRRSSLWALTAWATLFALIGNIFVLYDNLWAKFCRPTTYFVVFLYFAISMLRFLGQNTLPVLGRMKIVHTFDKHQGVLFSVNGIFVSLSTGLAPRIMRALSKNGWHCAYQTLSFVALLALGLYFLFFRETGNRTAHVLPAKASAIYQAEENVKVLPRRQLLKMSNFWCLMIPLCINSFIGSGITVHILDVFRETQMGAKLAVNNYLYMSYSTIIASMIFGRLFDKNKIKQSIVAILLMQLIGLIGLEISRNIVGIWLYVACIGGSWGGYGVLISTAYGKLFGKKNLGAILGLVQFFSSIVGALSVFLMSFTQWLFGSYFYLVRLIECVIVAVLIFVVRRFNATV